jgi:hypothetical protein
MYDKGTHSTFDAVVRLRTEGHSCFAPITRLQPGELGVIAKRRSISCQVF